MEVYNSTHTGEQIDTDLSRIVNLIYPVGSIYMSLNSTNLATLFGGTWAVIEGKFLIGSSLSYVAGATGGAASVTSEGTAITIDQMPAHNHESTALTGTVQFRNINNNDHNLLLNGNGIFLVTRTDWSGTHDTAGKSNWETSYKYNNLVINVTHTYTAQGSGQAHTHIASTMSPYLVVYMWRRTA